MLLLFATQLTTVASSSVALSYDSGTVDGQTAATQAQAN
jgi:hypothetical protein